MSVVSCAWQADMVKEYTEGLALPFSVDARLPRAPNSRRLTGSFLYARPSPLQPPRRHREVSCLTQNYYLLTSQRADGSS